MAALSPARHLRPSFFCRPRDMCCGQCQVGDSRPQLRSEIYRKYMRHIRSPSPATARPRPFTAFHLGSMRADGPLMQPCLTLSKETGMGHEPRGQEKPIAMVQRRACAGSLQDPAHMAWEIVRRRSEYRGEPARRTIICSAPQCMLVEAPPTANPWGLDFR